ncbi:MAG: 3-hydroxyacyl-CoA dehydrogenase NAD-binding domain-containing protein [Alphaproteobacteria bacterium]
MTVSLEAAGAIGLITIDNPPVNAASHAVRAGLADALARLEARQDLVAGVLRCAGRTFVAGADLNEFGRPPADPTLPVVVAALRNAAKPIVAAIHGTALGGGLELALACQGRVAAADAMLGFPEVHVGVVPGAGGTQMLPRLAGVAAAIDLITSGRRVATAEATELGLVDRIADGELVAAATALAQDLADGHAVSHRFAEAPVDDAGIDWDRIEADVTRAARGLQAPLRALDAIRAAARMPLSDGLAHERALFVACRDSREGRALRHTFLAERGAAQGGAVAAEPAPVTAAGVVGAGTMGRGIALCLLAAGLPVTLVDSDDAALERARDAVADLIDGDAAKDRISATEAAARKARLATATTPAALGACDLVIEAVFEDLAVKTALFAELGRILAPGALLATNTSYLDVAALAQAAGRPTRVIGLHFFSPAHLMKLLEVVVPAGADARAVATAFALARRMGKVAVRAGNAHGFIGNRIWSAYRRHADYLVEDGAAPQQVDRAMQDFGFRMGPFAAIDLAGLDIGLGVRRHWREANPTLRHSDLADRLCAIGRTGQKTGAGWYRYEPGGRTALPDPAVDALIAEAAVEHGIVRRPFDDAEIRERLLAAMVNEACHVLAEGTARCAADIDVVFLNGYGFPRPWGGPLFWADEVGVAAVSALVDRLAAADPTAWQVAPLLASLAADGRRFAELEAA